MFIYYGILLGYTVISACQDYFIVPGSMICFLWNTITSVVKLPWLVNQCITKKTSLWSDFFYQPLCEDGFSLTSIQRISTQDILVISHIHSLHTCIINDISLIHIYGVYYSPLVKYIILLYIKSHFRSVLLNSSVVYMSLCTWLIFTFWSTLAICKHDYMWLYILLQFIHEYVRQSL